MTDSLCQAHIMVSSAEPVVILMQQLHHGLAFLVAHVAITGCLVQLPDMWWDGPLAL